MATRVDPEQYSDTPIFREMLRDRRGRWPGIPVEELPPARLMPTTVLRNEAPQAPPVMSLVEPIAPVPERARPYAKEFLAYDPEETAPMLLPHVSDG